MGKGDQRTRKGKIVRGTHGKTRPKNEGPAVAARKRRNPEKKPPAPKP